MEKELNCWTDDVETYVAYSADDAKKAQHEFIGENPEDDTCWNIVPQGQEMTIYDDNFQKTKTQTAAKWCKENGRGFLCSTEF